MMKSIFLSGAVIALLVFSGCSKEPSVDESASQAQTVTQPAVEAVSSDNGGVTADTEEMKMAKLEKEMSSIYFDFDKFVIRADMKDKVSSDVKVANGDASAYNIKLEGNCDEWGSDEYNFALGLKRANTTKDALVAEGVPANRISMVSFGETNPSCTDKTQECWAKNRRVDFKILP